MAFPKKTLLSLHPPPAGGGSGAMDVDADPANSGAAWPDPEDLLKESLRQSLCALRTLRESKKLVLQRRTTTSHVDTSGSSSSSSSMGAGAGAPSVWDVEGMVSQVVANLRGAREVLVCTPSSESRGPGPGCGADVGQGWAEQQLEMETTMLREQLLKG